MPVVCNTVYVNSPIGICRKQNALHFCMN